MLQNIKIIFQKIELMFVILIVRFKRKVGTMKSKQVTLLTTKNSEKEKEP